MPAAREGYWRPDVRITEEPTRPGMTGGAPRHVAIIPDGNRRWAARGRAEDSTAGYGAGVDRFFDLLGVADEAGVRFVTLYVLSTENWRRGERETAFLSSLLAEAIGARSEDLARCGVRVRFIGRREGLGNDLRERMRRLEDATASGDRLVLSIAFNYGGQAEIADAARALVAEGLRPEQVDEDAVARRLYAPEVPEVDLLIRSGGEMRLSNFMLWRAAYAELYVTETLWPDFTAAEFLEALDSFARRERRRGGTAP